MTYSIDSNGNLVMKAGDVISRMLRREATRSGDEDYLSREQTERAWLKAQGWTWVEPEEIGALTSAPIITHNRITFYGYMDYQVKSFLPELAAGHEVIWTKA